MSRKKAKTKTIDDLYEESTKMMIKEVEKLKGRSLTQREIENARALAKVLSQGVLKDMRIL